MKRWRRPLILLALLLLAGAVVNVAVAWDSANRRLPKTGTYAWDFCDDPTGNDDIMSWAAAKGLRADRRVWQSELGGGMVPPVFFNLGLSGRGSRERPADDFKEQWGSLFTGPGGAARPMAPYGTEEAHGWPFRCLWGGMVWESDSDRPKPVWAIALAEGDGSLSEAHYLPLCPLFPGFLLNTLFYAAAVAPILALPLSVFPIRRHIRARRGRCPKCGYDLAGLGGAEKGGAPCPECGATR